MGSVCARLGLSSATRFMVCSRGTRRIPCRLACSRGIVFPMSMTSGTSMGCAIRRKAPSVIGTIICNHYCPRHLSSVT